MIEVGLVCKKLKGRDASKVCVIVDVLDKNMVLIDGETRRRKCNINHLEPTGQKLKIKKNADREEIKKIFKSDLKIELIDKKSKPKKERQKTKRVLTMLEKQKNKQARPKKEKTVPVKKAVTKPVKKKEIKIKTE